LDVEFSVDVYMINRFLCMFCLHLDDGRRHYSLGCEQTSRFRGSKFCWVL